MRRTGNPGMFAAAIAALTVLGLVALAVPALADAPKGKGSDEDEDEAWLAGDEAGGDAAAPEEGEAQPAASGEEAQPAAAATPAGGEGGEAQPAGSQDEAWLEGKEVKEVAPPVEDTTYTLKEDPAKWYYGIGARSYFLPVPGGEQEWFGLDKAGNVWGWMAGIEAVFKHKGTSYIPYVVFSQLSNGGGSAYREKGDDITETEIWSVDWKSVIVGIDFRGSYTIKDWAYFTYGAGIGFIFRTDPKRNSLVRTEAYRYTNPVTGKVSWEPCDGPGDPPSGAYCEMDGGHYHRNWEGWGADPFYAPFIDIMLGFLFKPIPNLYISAEVGLVLPVLPAMGLRMGYLF